MISLNTLRSFESDLFTVSDILSAYYSTSKKYLMNELVDDIDGMIGYWASCNDCSPSEIIDCIDYHFNDTANFKILKEVGSSGGWPDCLLKVGNLELFMDWVIND